MVELLRKGAKKRELAQVATLPRAIHDVQRQKPSTAVPHGQGEEGAMTSTNEDVVVLATAPSDDGKQLLVVRHLPDRGTYWSWFTRKGDPNHPRTPAWLTYTGAMDSVLSLTVSGVGMIDDFAADHKCAFWANFGI
jgi:carboxylesterase type B